MKSLVSIIIVNWNAKEYLKECINSLLAQTYQNYEIILVDNASTDNSIELVEKEFSTVKIIKNTKNIGFAEGNNVGIKNSKGDIIALFNPDAVADKEWLSILVSKLQSSEKIGAVAGKIFYLGNEYGKNAVFCTWPKLNPYTAMPVNFHNNEPTSKVDYLSGAAMIVKKEVIETVGLLDPGFFMYFEETDWCARMIRAGYDLVYVPEAKAWHVVSPSISNQDKKTYLMERSRIRFAIKNFDIAYLLFFHFYFFLESTFVFFRDIKNLNFIRTKIRFKAIKWNLTNFQKTQERKKKDISFLHKAGIVRSYNKSLPLRQKKVEQN